MKITLEKIDDGYGLKAKAGHHELLMDSSEEVGGHDGGFRPLYLMLVSLAGCTSMDLIFILRKGKHHVGAYEASVEAERRDEHPKIFSKVTMRIKVETDASDAALDRALRMTREKYCAAHAILQASGPVDVVLERI